MLFRSINELDLEEPLENEVYEELTPLLESIDKQNKEKEAIITSEDLAQPLSQKQTDTEPDHIVYDMFFARIYG